MLPVNEAETSGCGHAITHCVEVPSLYLIQRSPVSDSHHNVLSGAPTGGVSETSTDEPPEAVEAIVSVLAASL